MSKNTTTKQTKEPKTIKVRTVVISMAVIIGLIASFIGGIVYANNYNDTVKAQAFELSSKIQNKK